MYPNNSLLNNKWKVKYCNERESLMVSQRHNLSLILVKLLNIRNIDNKYIDNFLYPELNTYLQESYSLKDMKKSIERIVQTILSKKLIGIIADYDVDGSTSAAILSKFFSSINQKYILKTCTVYLSLAGSRVLLFYIK